MGKQGKPGASLRTWREFFPNAQVIGIDIDKKSIDTDNDWQWESLTETDYNN